MSLQAETNEGWEARHKAIQKHMADTRETIFNPYPLLQDLEAAGLITHDEYVRSSWKMRLIEPFLRHQILNMIKGTIKYPTDDWPTEVWRYMGRDDKVDSVNYDLLFEDHLHKEGKL